MPTYNTDFGQTVRERREEKKKADPHFSLRQFAQTVGISATYLSKVETGEFPPPSAEKIKKMAELLDLNADELLALAGKVDPDLPEIIREQPKAVADFLRTAQEHGLTGQDFQKLTDKIRKGKI
ncbi:MAG: helix-turn-helix domain-containing protein [Acidobacteria bacterium]|nr:helix-turn-helix domain-containing protein [Acidobacteriota bacterium]